MLSVLPERPHRSFEDVSPLIQCSLVNWLPWVLGAPLLVFVGMRFRLRARRWVAPLLAHVCACAVILGLSVLAAVYCCPKPSHEFPKELEEKLQLAAEQMARMGHAPSSITGGDHDTAQVWQKFHGAPPEGFPVPVRGFPELPMPGEAAEWMVIAEPQIVPMAFVLEIPVYVILALIVQALLAFGELKDRSVLEASLRAQLSQAQLTTLRMQVKPHFLFNALNGVSAVMAEDVTKARTILSALSAILRASFDDLGQQEVQLRQEMDLVRQYTKIQCLRFGDRMQVSVDVPAELEGAYVPVLCLQPIVENSVVHGVEKSTQPCEVKVVVKRVGDELKIEISDDGPGVGSSDLRRPEGGVGLTNTRERLTELYGAAGQVQTEELSPRGHKTTVTLPYHTSPRADV